MHARDDKYLMPLKISNNSIHVLVHIHVGICAYINTSTGTCISALDTCRCSIDAALPFCYEFHCTSTGNSGQEHMPYKS